MPMPTPIPVLAPLLIPELVAIAVGELEFDVCVEVAAKRVEEALVMSVEGEAEVDETVAPVEREVAALILKLLLWNSGVVLPGLNKAKKKVLLEKSVVLLPTTQG